MQTHSTSKGADYGVTSPMTQFQVYRNAIQARQKLGLFHEVEWVQHVRSYAMTRFAVEHPRLRLGDSGQLNVILLFGFSPRLPFPETYQQFRAVIESAKSLEYDIGEPCVRKRKVSITVGAAVMPQHAAQHFRPLDVGPRAGTRSARCAGWPPMPRRRTARSTCCGSAWRTRPTRWTMTAG